MRIALYMHIVLVFVCSCSNTAEQGCKTDADCPSGRYCAAGGCIYDCIMDQQCPEGFVCTVRGRCERGCSPTNNGKEICDGLDNDCDGKTDEDWPELGSICSNKGCPEGIWICAVDGNGIECNGPVPSMDDSECNGVDDDCDGDTDEDAQDRLCPKQQGVCEGTTQKCLGVNGWSKCDYGNKYSDGLDDSCDQTDNDCDGFTDEDAKPLLIVESGELATDEMDNNCNGLIDEPGGVMVPHPTEKNLWIDAYETVISQDAQCTGPFFGQSGDDYPSDWGPGLDGSMSLYACSLPGIIPSGYLSWYRAKRACEAQGKRLCEPGEWSIACNHGTSMIYPYGPQYIEGLCNDAWHSLKTGVEQVELTGSYDGCTSVGEVFDASGNLAEWINAWSVEYPGRAVFAGYGYRCEVCNSNGSCHECELDSYGDNIIITRGLRCKVYDGREEYCAFPESVRSYFGVRCCYSRD